MDELLCINVLSGICMHVSIALMRDHFFLVRMKSGTEKLARENILIGREVFCSWLECETSKGGHLLVLCEFSRQENGVALKPTKQLEAPADML